MSCSGEERKNHAVLLRPAFRTGGKLRALGRKVLSYLVCLKPGRAAPCGAPGDINQLRSVNPAAASLGGCMAARLSKSSGRARGISLEEKPQR